MDLRADFLIIGSGIAGLRAAAELAGAGDVLDPHQGRARRKQHRLRAGRHRRGGRPRRFARSCTPPTRIAAGDGLCDERAVRVLVEDGPRYVRELIDWGARVRPRRDGQPALGRSKGRTACAACCTRATRPAARSAACSGSACRRMPRVQRRIEHARVVDLRRRATAAAPARVPGRRRRASGSRGDGDAARDRRRRAGLPRDDQPAGRDRRRRRAGVSRRRARRRSRVRPVSSRPR